MTPGTRDEQEEDDSDGGDELLTDSRGRPVPPEEIYLEEASVYRPIVTGDVFSIGGTAQIAGAPGVDLVMVTSHPSGMRRGPVLEEYVRIAPVVVDSRLSEKKANVRVIDLFPLPKLNEFHFNADALDAGPWGVRVDHAQPIPSSVLAVGDRHTCLSGYGMALLFQCITYSDSRVLIREDTIKTRLAPKLIEIEWLESWTEDLVRPLVESGAPFETALREGAVAFDAVMTADRGGGRTLQSMIADLNALATVEAERLMSAELRARREALGV